MIEYHGTPGNFGAQVASLDNAPVAATAISTALNDNKFITLQHGIYEVTHSRILVNIINPTTFNGLTDISVNKDGTNYTCH